jgi:signal transduction histidine kinase
MGGSCPVGRLDWRCYIFQEALTNVHRHADATACRVRLSLVTPTNHSYSTVSTDATSLLELEITDDGRGLLADSQTSSGLGLTSMRERAAELGGTCIVEPMTGGGTRLYARLPCFQT